MESMSRKLCGVICLLITLLSCSLFQSLNVNADPIKSANYSFDESVIGNGGLVQSSSANYQARDSTGELSVGGSSSGGYSIETGSITTPDPTLSFAVNNGSVNFSDFSATAPSTTTTSFSVTNYTSYGYVVQIFGNPPSNGSHTINAMTTLASSQVGIEQFGINLVANTSPLSFGSNPNNGQFGFGSVETNYNTANKYRYVSGDAVATAPKSSGMTVYTISYLINVNSLTQGGQYTSNQTLIITGTY